jgi:hypothetical protein
VARSCSSTTRSTRTRRPRSRSRRRACWMRSATRSFRRTVAAAAGP